MLYWGVMAHIITHYAGGGTTKLADRTLDAYRNDPIMFLESHSWIMTKGRKRVRFAMNEAQREFWEVWQAQWDETGMVRLLDLKSRQLGMSTFIARLFMHRMLFEQDLVCAMVCHSRDALPGIKNHTYLDAFKMLDDGPWTSKLSGAQNAKVVESTNSQIHFSYASGKEILRGITIPWMHLSEAGLFESISATGGADTLASATSAVPPDKGTVIVMETTSGGPHGVFYNLWQARDTEYRKVFIGTQHGPEYSRPVPEGFELTSTEEKYRDAKGLSNEQMVWRRSKMAELGETKFFREFPYSDDEAFAAAVEEGFITIDAVRAAFVHGHENPDPPDVVKYKQQIPLVFGIDVSDGKDKTVVLRRRGYDVEGIGELDGDLETKTFKIVDLVYQHMPYAVFVDANGIGAAVYQRLLQQGLSCQIFGLTGQSTPSDKRLFSNLRAETWAKTRNWLQDGKGQVRIFCSPEQAKMLQQELIVHKGEIDETGKLVMVKKNEIKKVLGRSPDYADALTYTFAYNLPYVQYPTATIFPGAGREGPSQRGFGVAEFSVHGTQDDWNRAR